MFSYLRMTVTGVCLFAAVLLPSVNLRAANTVQIENAKAGSSDWQLADPATNHEIEGYASLAGVSQRWPDQLFCEHGRPHVHSGSISRGLVRRRRRAPNDGACATDRDQTDNSGSGPHHWHRRVPVDEPIYPEHSQRHLGFERLGQRSVSGAPHGIER